MKTRIATILLILLFAAPLSMAESAKKVVTASGNATFEETGADACSSSAASVTVELDTEGEVEYSYWSTACTRGFVSGFDAEDCTGGPGTVIECLGVTTHVDIPDCPGYTWLWLGTDGEFHYDRVIYASSCDGTIQERTQLHSSPNLARVDS